MYLTKANYGTIERTEPTISTIKRAPDKYQPPFHAITRRSVITAGIFNIVCTSLDGTALSLPFMMEKCGLVLGCLIVLLFAGGAMFTLQLICVAAKKIRAVSYTEIVQKLFGLKVRVIFSTVLFLVLFSILVGFLILMRQIACSLIISAFGYTDFPSTLALVLLSILCFPLMLADNLHTLRYSCYLGFFSILVLIISLAVIILPSMLQHPVHTFKNTKLFPDNLADVLESIPIVTMLYISHFNVLGVFTQLHHPTTKRMNRIIYTSISIITALFLCIGILGYLTFKVLFHGIANDNILQSFPPEYHAMIAGRIGLLITLICTVPVMMVPARALLMEFEECFETNVLHVPEPHKHIAPILELESLRDHKCHHQHQHYLSQHDESLGESSLFVGKHDLHSYLQIPFEEEEEECKDALLIGDTRDLMDNAPVTMNDLEGKQQYSHMHRQQLQQQHQPRSVIDMLPHSMLGDLLHISSRYHDKEDDEDDMQLSPSPPLSPVQRENPFRRTMASATTGSADDDVGVGFEGLESQWREWCAQPSADIEPAPGVNELTLFEQLVDAGAIEKEEEEMKEEEEEMKNSATATAVMEDELKDIEEGIRRPITITSLSSSHSLSSLWPPPSSSSLHEQQHHREVQLTQLKKSRSIGSDIGTTAGLLLQQRLGATLREAFARGQRTLEDYMMTPSSKRNGSGGMRNIEKLKEEEQQQQARVNRLLLALPTSSSSSTRTTSSRTKTAKRIQPPLLASAVETSSSSAAAVSSSRNIKDQWNNVMSIINRGWHRWMKCIYDNNNILFSCSSLCCCCSDVRSAGSCSTNTCCRTKRKIAIKYIVTATILTLVVLTAISVPDAVSEVWQIAGSCVGMLISLVLPTLIYIRLKTYLHVLRNDIYTYCSWLTILITVPTMLICSLHNMKILRF